MPAKATTTKTTAKTATPAPKPAAAPNLEPLPNKRFNLNLDFSKASMKIKGNPYIKKGGRFGNFIRDWPTAQIKRSLAIEPGFFKGNEVTILRMFCQLKPDPVNYPDWIIEDEIAEVLDREKVGKNGPYIDAHVAAKLSTQSLDRCIAGSGYVTGGTIAAADDVADSISQSGYDDPEDFFGDETPTVAPVATTPEAQATQAVAEMNPIQDETPDSFPDKAEAIALIRTAKTMDELKNHWECIPENIQNDPEFDAAKDEMKEKIKAAETAQ